MKQFLLFSGDTYYPGGGWEDYKGDYATQEEAIAASKADEHDWFQIVDLQTTQIVHEGGL